MVETDPPVLRSCYMPKSLTAELRRNAKGKGPVHGGSEQVHAPLGRD